MIKGALLVGAVAILVGCAPRLPSLAHKEQHTIYQSGYNTPLEQRYNVEVVGQLLPSQVADIEYVLEKASKTSQRFKELELVIRTAGGPGEPNIPSEPFLPQVQGLHLLT